MQKTSFLAFLSEYYLEQKEISNDIPPTFTDFLNTVSVEELIEVAELYGNSRYNSGACSWKLAFPEITIDDIAELSSLKR